MGMSARLTALWSAAIRNSATRTRTSDIGNGYGALSKVFRMALGNPRLAAGAVLVIRGEASPGIIIAARS